MRADRAAASAPPQPAAPAAVSTLQPKAEWAAWYGGAIALTQQNLRYPPRSLNDGEEGDLSVKIRVKRDGTIVNVKLLQLTPYQALNQEVIDLYGRIGKFPPVPADYSPEKPEIEFTMPVNFKLSDSR
jgi:protein TonB